MPDCVLAANACVAACTLLVLGVALTCCVRWPFGFGGSDFSVTGERSSCYGGAFFLLRESVLPVTGECSSCYGRAFFLLREADFSVGRIDFSTSRKCFSAFAQVHLSPFTSVFMYSCRCFSVFSQVFFCILAGGFMYSHKCFYVFLQLVSCAPTSASRSLHEQLACMQAGLLPRPTLPCCGAVWWNCQVLKKRYRNLYVRNSIPLIERFPYRLHDATTCVLLL